MKQWIALALLVICLMSQSFLSFSRSSLFPIFDAPLNAVVPRNLRISKVPLENTSLNFRGLNKLKASGSGQFSEKTFIEMSYQLPTNLNRLVVLDLRQESHGLVNGTPISWTDGHHNYGNVNKTKKEIEADEQQRLQLAVQAGRILVNPVEEPAKLIVSNVKTEREFVESLGCTYIRLPVVDHNRPSDQALDQFIDIVNTLSNDQWVHFHCKAGKGRTTTFMTLLDIMQNAQYVSLEDILARQQLIGGIDLNETNKKTDERVRAAKERIEFIQQFYTYCKQVPDFHMTWSDWANQQAIFVANR